MKILHVLNSNRFSGAENVVCQIIKLFQSEENYEMAYCSPEGEVREALDERNVKFLSVDKMSILELKKIIKEYNPDVIHAHDMKASFISALVCGKIKLLTHIHNSAYDSRRISLKSIAYLYAGIRSKHIFWVSQSSYNSYIFNYFLKKKSEVLNNVIDINEVYRKCAEDINQYNYDLVYCGRISEPKDPYRLLDICKVLQKEKKDIRIAIIGTGELESDVRKKAEELQLQVEFLGFKSNPLKIIATSKSMIMTSKREGTPMVALEALALGVPLVATPVDGLINLIDNGENGFLSNDNSILVEKILNIINNKELRLVLSNNARIKSEIYNDLEKYKNCLMKVYDNKI